MIHVKKIFSVPAGLTSLQVQGLSLAYDIVRKHRSALHDAAVPARKRSRSSTPDRSGFRSAQETRTSTSRTGGISVRSRGSDEHYA